MTRFGQSATPEDFADRPVLVAGTGVAGSAAAAALLAAGARVALLDRADGPAVQRLVSAGATATIADPASPAEAAGLLGDAVDVVVSPGFAPHHPVAAAAVGAGLDVYSEPELAWRLRGPQAPDWLAITGTNGKTTTTTMLATILAAAGLRSAALGNIGTPLVSVSADTSRYDVLAVELSSFQLHWSSRMAPHAGAMLNIADDHLDWHGGFAAYRDAKIGVWRSFRSGGVAMGNLDDEQVRLARIAAMTDDGSGCLLSGASSARWVGWTLGEPAPGQLGVVDGMLVDAAFGEQPQELVAVEAICPPGSHNVSNALAAAGLALSHGVSVSAVREGLTGYTPQRHRNAFVATVSGVGYVDDSKATNPHAAMASLLAYPRVVWIAGGQLKGVDVDAMVAAVADRLAGAVLLGVDREQLAVSLAKHAPGVPVVEVAETDPGRWDDNSAVTDPGAMTSVVEAAAHLAAPGDTVLLAPAAASLDMYDSYARRGAAFVAAVHRLPGWAP